MNEKISLAQELKKYLPLLVLPILFSFMLYFFVQSFLIRQLEQGAERTLDLFYQQVSAMTSQTENVARSINSDFTMLINSRDSATLPYSFSNPPSICRQIEIRKEDSPYLDHIYYISAEDDAIYSDAGYFTYSSLPSILAGLGLSTEDFLQIEEAGWSMSTADYLKEPYYVVPFRDSEGGVYGRLILTVSLDKFTETVSSLDAAFSCLYSQDFLISSRPLDTGFSVEDLTTEDRVGELLGRRVKCFYITKGDYTCLIARSFGDYYRPLTWMVLGFLLYILLVFTIDFCYLLRVSKARYAEITTLIHALPQDSGAGSSYHDLVPAVQTALLNAADLQEQKDRMNRDHMLRDLLHRENRSDLPMRYAEALGIPVEGTAYCLARFLIRKWENIALAASAPEDRHQLALTIFKTSLDQFREPGLSCFSSDDANAFYALYCGDLSLLSGKAEEISARVCGFLNEEYGIQLQAAISQPTEDFTGIPGLMDQTRKLDAFSRSIDSTATIISEDLLKGRSESFISGNFFHQQMTLSSTLLAKKYDAVPGMVEAILTEHVTNNPDYKLGADRLRAVACTLAEGLLSIRHGGPELAESAARLREAESVSRLISDTKEIFGRLDAAPVAPTAFREVEEACDYISRNLADKNLNVTMISEAVGSIPQRLIPMFQKQLGMGIAEYVNSRRIETATGLLTSTRLKVTQISDQVGYCNTDTFTRNFRKLMGLTPTEYRQMNQQA